MKKGIHPKWHDNVKVVHNGKVVMTVQSTEEEIVTEIWSGNHPFYTGKESLVDTDNLVEKFEKKVQKASGSRATKATKRKRRVQKKKDYAASTPKTLKDMLSNLGK